MSELNRPDTHDEWKTRAEKAEAALKRADHELSELLDIYGLTFAVEEAIDSVRAGIKDGYGAAGEAG